LLAVALPLLIAAAWLAAAQEPEGVVRVRVTEAGSAALLPCRLTVLDADGRMAPPRPGKEAWLAARPGVLYTGTGEGSFSLPRGRYTLYANRGLEYGLATRALTVGAAPVAVSLEVSREVDTTGEVDSRGVSSRNDSTKPGGRVS
jgi:hypothetical protein